MVTCQPDQPVQGQLGVDGALSCYAPSFARRGEPELRSRYSVHGELLGFYAPGWLWLPGAADCEGIKAWHRQKRLRRVLEALDGRHRGEAPLWLRWSHPGDVVALVASWRTYRNWWRRYGGSIDLVGVVDRSPRNDVSHIHGYAYGERLELVRHAEAWGRAGGYPFVYARSFRIRAAQPFGVGVPSADGPGAEARSYLVRKLRGYITAKQGSRYLRLRVA